LPLPDVPVRYQGGKYHLCKYYLPFLLSAAQSVDQYVEPFVGAAHVASRLVLNGLDLPVYLSDLSLDLILMYQQIQSGEFVPPYSISEELYQQLRNSEPSALRGFAGYGASWGGKFFGGYARGHPGEDIVRASNRAVAKTSRILSHATFACHDYRDLALNGRSLIYCDPPYRDTTGYLAKDFDSDLFWKVVSEWASSNAVFVSEVTAPAGWIPVWEAQRNVNIRGNIKSSADQLTEKLFVHENQLDVSK
jgi:DNA adenine methylase